MKKQFAPIIVTPYNPPTKQKGDKKPNSIATAERHMQIIAEWERLRYITPAKAKELRDRLLKETNQKSETPLAR
jgi:hypothetical protein